MALSAIEDRYLSTLTEREFPTFTPDQSLMALPEGVDSVQLAAGPSATVSDAGSGMPEIRATPRNPVMGGVADFVRGVRDLANQYEIKDFVPLLGGMGVGDLLIGKSPEELEEWAYGNAPMRIPEMSNVPIVKTGRKEQLADTLFLGVDAAGIGKGAGVAARGAKNAGKALAPKAGEMLGDYMQRSGLQPNLVAFHGTPHKFDKFDSKKIGTGEGNQAFGHGLYFAENKGVAGEYAMMEPAGGVIPSAIRSVNGVNVEPGTGAYKAASLLDSMTLPQAKKLAKGWMESSRPEEAEYFAEVVSTLDGIKDKRDVKSTAPKGNLMTVDIPDDMVSKMLDFDTPLSDQTPEIQAKLKAVVDGQMGAGTWDEWLKSDPDFKNLQNDLFEDKAPEEVSELLREAGIPGLRYLDAGSRQTPNITEKRLADLYEKHDGDAQKAVDEFMQSVYNTPKKKEQMREQFMRQLETPKTRNIVVFPGGEADIKILKTEGTK